jgi:hypothetical protein
MRAWDRTKKFSSRSPVPHLICPKFYALLVTAKQQVAGGVVEELRLACCGVVEAEGPRLAVALSRDRVLLVVEQGQCCV